MNCVRRCVVSSVIRDGVCVYVCRLLAVWIYGRRHREVAGVVSVPVNRSSLWLSSAAGRAVLCDCSILIKRAN